ncbi:MAG: hypothetical protein H2057_06275 [Alphaproteobacteria bacterium]|nr:hypothetical protein [Alphaproteobacteria bacterium]
MNKLWMAAFILMGISLGVLVYKGKTTLDLPVTFNPEPTSDLKTDVCVPKNKATKPHRPHF